MDLDKLSFAQKMIMLCSELEKYRVDIESALRYGHGGLDYDEVVSRVIKGQYHFYPLPNSVMIMELIEYSNGEKAYHGIIAAGNLQEIADMHPKIEKVAREFGCNKLVISGRRGWLKAFKPYGWREQQTVIEKSLDTELGEEPHEQKDEEAGSRSETGNRPRPQEDHGRTICEGSASCRDGIPAE